jgi:hypothetical protein
MQNEMHAAEPSIPGHSSFEVELPIQKLKDTNDQILIKFWQNGLSDS